MQDQLHIRPAQQRDRETVFKFCEHSFDWGDYIPNVWDIWLKENEGKLFTATLNQKPVGIMHVTLPTPGEAWLQAARTHPKYRRKGIATALANTCLRWAESKGAKVVRLSTDSDNYAAQRALQKLKFAQISDFLIMECKGLQAEKTRHSRWARKDDIDRAWQFLKKSNIFKNSASLYTILFVWTSLEKRDLAKFVIDRKAIIYENGSAVSGLILIDETAKDVWEEKPLQTSYIDGDLHTITDMIRFFKNYSFQQGVTSVYAFALNSPTIATALTEAGFNREEPTTELIYQKNLTRHI